MTWWDEAACRNADPNIFFPGHAGIRAKKAKAICSGCPVKQECLEMALASTGDYEGGGIFGGLSARERMGERVGRRKSVA